MKVYVECSVLCPLQTPYMEMAIYIDIICIMPTMYVC